MAALFWARIQAFMYSECGRTLDRKEAIVLSLSDGQNSVIHL